MSIKGAKTMGRLLDEYIAAAQQGQAPPMEELLTRCPVADQEDLRLALVGVQSLIEYHWATYVSSKTVDDTLAEMMRIRQRKQRLQQAHERLERITEQRIGDPIPFLQTTLDFSPELLQTAATRPRTNTAAAWFRGQPNLSPRNRRALYRSGSKLLEQRMAETARELLGRYDLCQAPVDLEALARRLGLAVQEAVLDGIDGCLLADDDFGAILLNRRIPNRQRRRFTLAHEIAHFVLHRQWRVFRDTMAELGIASDDTEEVEANTLAAMLLVPPDLLPFSFGSQKPSLHQADEIAATYDVSPQTALRHVVRSSHWACALVVIEERRVKWWVESDYFDYFIRVGQSLHPSSIAAQLASHTSSLEVDALEDATLLPLSSWIETADGDNEATLREESRRLPGGYVYSLLIVE